MKITIIADTYGYGDNGTGNVTRQLAEGMLKLGHEVTILSSFEGESESGIKYVTTKHRFCWGIGWFIKLNGVVLAAPQKQKVIQSIQDADVVYCTIPFKCCKKAIKLAKKLKIPFVLGAHYQAENFNSQLGLLHNKLANKLIYRWAWNTYFKKGEYIHCPSKFVIDCFKEQGYEDRHYVVVSNGHKPNFTKQEVEKPKQFKDKFVILNSGRYVNEKRQDVLIRAVAQSKYRDKIELIFTGQGPQEKKYKRIASKYGVPAHFEYYSLEDYQKIMNMADLYVHASEVELQGLSCLDALVCGLPCIFADSHSSAAKDFAIDEHCLFKTGDSQDLAQKIDYMIEHNAEREEYAKKYLEQSKEHEPEACMKQMEKLFLEAIEYYKGYYKDLDKKRVENDPSMFAEAGAHDHVVEIKHKKKRKIVDANYKYENKSIIHKIHSAIWWCIAKTFLPPALKIKYRYKIIGKKKLKNLKGKGAVVVCNHCLIMDAPLIGACVFGRRKVRFLSMSNNLGIPVAGNLIVAMGAYPTADDIGGARNLQKSVNKVLQNNKLFLIYPEGSLVPYCTEIREFHSGAFKFAVTNDVPILPIVITFKERLRKNNKSTKYQAIINICDTLEYNKDLRTRKEQVIDLQNRTHDYMAEFMNEFYAQNPVITLKHSKDE